MNFEEFLTQPFEERCQEIAVYLDFLESIEREAQSGAPRVGTTTVTAQQQKILYSVVYLQLYNLVEATVTWCLDAVCSAASENEQWFPGDLSVDLRREWVRFVARTDIDLNYENRLDSAFDMCEQLRQVLPIRTLEVRKGAGGNWADREIETISKRLGFSLNISVDVYRSIKRPFRDDKGPLELVKSLRNRLAHGSISFEQCGEGVTIRDLRDLNDRSVTYLKEVVSSFRASLEAYQFLIPASRPTA